MVDWKNSNHSLPAECVELMDSSGKVMDLEAKQHSVDAASSLLVERQYYVLLRVCRESYSTHQHNFIGNNVQIKEHLV